ncbi:MAG: hypothetical protein GWO08_20905 [Gammaproteobacteria bacterium]|nr:hypothetical protein [Gammaproteobacteria bacterium]NIN62729.1 hypothetical protein [Gammaproteobacteria bacterium]NIO63710.1 hypothetical protein [Gammaproteobacteria bacterium]NIP50088.1 hypothetical protein [Gammaproteobacteria bacterium]NIQ12306.1 hypothetical protein [Gammaproteobacteria bacterium]
MLLRILHRWHRRFGIVAALFVVMLVVTGLMLNHTDGLKLDRNHIQNALLLDHYNINPRQEPVTIRVNSKWISQVGERLYFNDREIRKNVTELIGALPNGQELIIAFDEELLVVNDEGIVIESLRGAQGVPAGMRAIGKTINGNIVVNAAHGDYIVNLDSTEWYEQEDRLEADWSERIPLPGELRGILLKKYRGRGLTLERVLLDLHSGRLFGTFGVYIVDAAALLFLVLAFTGVWMWMSRLK